ncbi:MAG: outer membrane beta-barrel protein, partial [Caulobacter sp.]
MRAIVALGALTAGTTASAATLSELASAVEVSGWISSSYVHSFIDEDLALTRATDIESDSFQLNQAVLNLGSTSESGFGGFVSLMIGEDADRLVNSSYGEGAGDKIGIPEAYISYTSGAWTIKGGRYGTLAGYEVVSDAANPLLSRSLQFPAAEPYYHTGVRAAYAASDSTTLYFGVANSAFGGFADDSNEQKTIEAGASFALSESFSLGIYDYYGTENDIGSVNYFDVVASLAASEKLTLAANFDWYKDDFGDITGIAAYATYQMNDRWATTVRLESLKRDFDGGPNYTVRAATVDLAFTPTDNFRVLFEARIDDADEDIYVKDAVDGTFTGRQPTVGIKGIYAFG